MHGLSKLARPAQSWLLARKDYLVVLCIVALALFLSYQLGFPRVSWSDEVYYAVVARNLVEHGTLQTTLYLPEAIVRGGYPLHDVHMPGYMILLAFPIAILGPTDAAMVLPSQVAYLLAGLLVFWAGKRLFSRAVGYVSAVAFSIYPLFFHFANTAMAELSVVLIAMLYFAVWIATLENPHLYQSLGLVVLLIAGTLVRETFLMFLLPALYILWRWPSATRWRARILFGLSFFVLVAGVVYPLSLNRSYYPNNFNEVLDRGDFWLIVKGFWDNFVLQASRYISRFDIFPQHYIQLMQSFLVLLGAVSFVRFKKVQKAAAGYFLFTYLGMLFLLSIFYSSTGWRGLRGLMMTLPPALIVFNGLVFSLRWQWVKYCLVVAQLVLFSLFAWYAMEALVADRVDFYMEESPKAQLIAENVNAYHPKVVMGYKPWLYALKYFPVTVIWRLPESLEMMQKVQQHVVIDAIVVDNPGQRDEIIQASQERMIAGKFRPINQEAIEGYFFLVRDDLFKQPIGASLGPDLTLLGVDTVSTVTAGGALPLTLVWKAQADITSDYAIAVRLLDKQGQEAQYWLGRPVLSSHPTTEWQQGDVVPDTWDITLDRFLLPGLYDLEIEVYEATAGQSVGKTTIGRLLVEPAGQ
jgi:4-amino-4-deoxy-L-arabinose transferase-like glycosyltransferase